VRLESPYWGSSPFIRSQESSARESRLCHALPAESAFGQTVSNPRPVLP
jgi:hypothetical protein